ncbi:MAG: hypothetical protein Q9165_007319 [Trypethelium subeluteriae]
MAGPKPPSDSGPSKGSASKSSQSTSSKSGKTPTRGDVASSAGYVPRSPPRYDGNRDPDPGPWQEYAGGAGTVDPEHNPITWNPRNLDLGGQAWTVIRGLNATLDDSSTLGSTSCLAPSSLPENFPPIMSSSMSSERVGLLRDFDLTHVQFIPDSPLPAKPKLNTTGKEIKLTLNTWPVKGLPVNPVWQYDVLIGNGVEKRGKIMNAWESPTLQGTLGPHWIFDGNRIAWSPIELKEVRKTLNLDEEYGRTRKREFPDEVTVVVRKAKEPLVKFDKLHAYLDGQTSFDNEILEAINFLDHLLRMWPSSRLTKIKRSFFAEPRERIALGDGVEAYHGVYASIRPVHSPMGPIMSVNVDVANGTFWSEGMVIHTARELGRCRDGYDLSMKCQPKQDHKLDKLGGRGESETFKLLRVLRKLSITVTHRGIDKSKPEPSFVIDKLLNQSAKEYTQKMRHPKTGKEEEMTIFQYFREKYNINLSYPDMPLIKTTKKDVVLPLELCKIKPKQRYVFKLNDRQISNMIKFAVTPPPQRWSHIKEGLEMLNWEQDPYLEAYGVKIQSQPAIVRANVLPNPKVQFGNGPHNPGTTGRWDLRGKKFMAGNSKELKSWGIMVVEGRGSPDKAAIERFIGEFIKVYSQHGGRVVNPKPVIMPSGANSDGGKMVEALWTATGNANKMRPQMLMFVLLSKEAKLYNRIKKSADCRYGVVSQCMQSLHVFKCQAQYISNVCMKFNAKLGGFTTRAIGVRNHEKFGSFNKATLIVGADVSHPAPGADIASTACMTFSTNLLCTRYAAAIDVNGHRVEIIATSNIEKFMKPMITGWASNLNMGRLPESLIYFRDGVSEGQYHQIIHEEIHDVKNLLQEINPHTKTKITVIVATKRHHIRFFPDNNDRMAADRNGNSLPGTLVQTGCTSPFEYDFYLCAHSAIKGTARPVGYHVLLDENNYPVNELQQMIYDHSYQYIRSTTPVSIHPAIYYAHLAAKRAISHEDKPSESGPQMKGKKIKKETSTSGDGEYKLLIPMPDQGGIRFEMWYV